MRESEEARRVAGLSDDEGVSLRLLGGVAVNARARDGLRPAFRREYADMDFIVPKVRFQASGFRGAVPRHDASEPRPFSVDAPPDPITPHHPVGAAFKPARA